MCYSNFTQHSGCGHIGVSRTQPLTLCDAAIKRLYELRGPNSPPISTQQPQQYFAPPKRSASRRRFFSLSQTLSRNSSIARQNSHTGETNKVTKPKSASSSFTPTTTVAVDIDYASLPEHQVRAVKCVEVVRRSKVASEMDVCAGCEAALGDMRSMLERYDKTGSVRGTVAFEQFLRFGDDRNYSADGDITIPIRDSVAGEHGAMQAIVLGHASDSPNLRERGGVWGTDADDATLSDHGPKQAFVTGHAIEGHPSEAGFLVQGGTNGLGYWKGDDVSSLATSRVFAGI